MREHTLKLALLSAVLCALPAVVSAGEDPAYWEPPRTPAWAITATSTRWLFPLMPDGRREASGFRALLRIINDSDREGQVRITGWDDAGKEYGPRTLYLQPRQSVNLTASELETGDGDAFPIGLGDGEGWWHLALDSTLDFQAGVWSRIGESLASLGAGSRTLTNTTLPAERASACTTPGTWGAIAFGFRDQSCSTESVGWFFAANEPVAINAYNRALTQCLEQGILNCEVGVLHQCGALAYGRSDTESGCFLVTALGATREEAEAAAVERCNIAPDRPTTGRRCEVPERAPSSTPPSGGEAPWLDALEVLRSPTHR